VKAATAAERELREDYNNARAEDRGNNTKGDRGRCSNSAASCAETALETSQERLRRNTQLVGILHELDGIEAHNTIQVGSLVRVSRVKETRWLLIVPPNSIAEKTTYREHKVRLVTLETPVGQELSGLEQGDTFDWDDEVIGEVLEVV
jgi:transcription elongation GreA/GreB family factor